MAWTNETKNTTTYSQDLKTPGKETLLNTDGCYLINTDNTYLLLSQNSIYSLASKISTAWSNLTKN